MIKDILKRCSDENSGCHDCPYNSEHDCSTIISQKALDLINHLQAENWELYKTLDYRAEKIRGLESENKRLKAENKKQQLVIEAVDNNLFPLPFETDYDKAIATAKVEATKEFAGRLKEKNRGEIKSCVGWVDFDDIDNLLKELVGDTE